MYFRPLPVLTLLTVLGLGVLLWLGSWQWSRMGEKAAEIAAYEAMNSRAPDGLVAALCPEIRLGAPVLLPEPTGRGAIRFWGRDGGEAGWRLFRPVQLPACARDGVILAETGFQPFPDGGETDVTRWRIEAVPEAGAFAAANSPVENEFHRYDAGQIADVLQTPSVHPSIWIVADRGLPAELAEVPPSRHLGYALTWFGLALTLIGVFAAFHVAKGRLGFTRR